VGNSDTIEGPEPRGATHTADGRELRALWQRFREKGDIEDRNALTEFYFDMVRAHSENIARILLEAVEENDLYQAGALAFFEAMQEYDPAAHGTFEEFGSVVIRHAIVNEIRALVGTDDEET
jgi:DNA-directed RNA polymerase specialized sigma subunit